MPVSLIKLRYNKTNILALNNLPINLMELYCSFSKITTITNLTSNLNKIYYSEEQSLMINNLKVVQPNIIAIKTDQKFYTKSFVFLEQY